MSSKRIFLFIAIILISAIGSWATEDDIAFYNVGQGHCTLVRRVGHVPLLIDAGSTQNVQRVENHQKNTQGSEKGERAIRSIVTKISEHWRDNQGSNGILNVIVTHGQKDHFEYIPTILRQLSQGRTSINFRVLLGGRKDHYQSKLEKDSLPCTPYYSADYLYNHSALFEGTNLGFWAESGCITHLFCPHPQGTNDPNTWSIITRVKINQQNRGIDGSDYSISAIIPGDAEGDVQQDMLRQMGQTRTQELQSNILLFPHHGAKPLDVEWIEAIKPQAVVISAGKYGNYYHPRAEALCSLFSALRLPRNNGNTLATAPTTAPERLWSAVDSHRIVYYDATGQFSQRIRSIFPTFRLTAQNFNYEVSPYEFVDVPWYINLDTNNNWKCSLCNFPVYTTYTSGSIVFKKDRYNIKPFEIKFIDMPSDIEKMAQEIQNLYIDDHQGDYSDFSRLSAQTQERSSRELQECRSEEKARKIFFLCYNIIPVEETASQDQVNSYREIHLCDHLERIRTYTAGLNFSNPNESQLFDRIQNVLFSSGMSIEDYYFRSPGFKGMCYLGFNLPEKLEKRMDICKRFFELAYPTRRETDNLCDVFDLFCLVHCDLISSMPDYTHEEFYQNWEWARSLGFKKALKFIQRH